MTTPRVNVILPFLNEGRSFSKALTAILAQEERGFVLNAIYVISDGSTDDTVAQATALNNPKIRVVDHKDKKGQLVRLNEGFQLDDADYIIQTDGDCEFGNIHVISSIVTEFKDSKVMMVAGNAQPREPKNFIERGICSTYMAYSGAASELDCGNNIWMVHGCVLAFRREFVKGFEVPAEVVVQDWFMYLRCMKEGSIFKFAKDALVYFSVPSTISDHIKQVKRYLSTSNLLNRFFDSEFIKLRTKQNIKLMLKHQMLQFIKAPVETIFVFIINRLVEIQIKLYKVKPSANWERVFAKV